MNLHNAANSGLKFPMKNTVNMVGYTFDRVFTIQI